jgi:hypothetical protein
MTQHLLHSAQALQTYSATVAAKSADTLTRSHQRRLAMSNWQRSCTVQRFIVSAVALATLRHLTACSKAQQTDYHH